MVTGLFYTLQTDDLLIADYSCHNLNVRCEFGGLAVIAPWYNLGSGARNRRYLHLDFVRM